MAVVTTMGEVATTLRVQVENLCLEYPIFDSQSHSLRNVALQLGTGGLVRRNSKAVSVRALEDISFTLNEGDRLGLIGHNGSGKSSLLRVLSSIYPPSSGVLRINGRVSALLSTGLGMEVDATGRENIMLCGQAMGMTRREVLSMRESIEDFTELGEFLDLPVRTYSSGMALRLSFGIASALAPDILLVDEVIGAGDQKFYTKARDRLMKLFERTQVMIMASHNTEILHTFCNKAMVLQKGRCIAFDDVDHALAVYHAS